MFASPDPPLHVVLVAPQIPPNTGNVARLCAVTGARLVLVDPLGFSIEECRALLALYEDEGRASSEVKQVAEEHLEQIDRKVAELQAMRTTLAKLIHRCHGDDRPDCPILDDLAGEDGATTAHG